jgi:hypothetical protein
MARRFSLTEAAISQLVKHQTWGHI